MGKCLRELEHGHNMQFQAGYPGPCKISGDDSCKACVFTQLHASTSTLLIGRLAPFAIRTHSLAVINESIQRGNGRKASPPTDAVASCLLSVSAVLNHAPQDLKLCWFPVYPITFRLFFT